MKKFMFLLWMFAAIAVACDEKGGDEPPISDPEGNLIEDLVFPEQTGALDQGAALEIQGKGFTEESKIYFRAEDGTETEGVVAEVTETGITVTLPELVGKFSVVLKQAGEEMTLGEVEIATGALVINDMEILPRKIKMIIYECTQVGDLDTLTYTTDPENILKFTERRSKSHMALSRPQVHRFTYDGNGVPSVEYVHEAPAPFTGDWEEDEENYSLTSKASDEDDLMGQLTYTMDGNRATSAKLAYTWYGGSTLDYEKDMTFSYMNGYLSEIKSTSYEEGEQWNTTETFSVSTEGLLQSCTMVDEYYGDTKTITCEYGTAVINSLHVDLWDLLFSSDMPFVSHDYSWGGRGEDASLVLGVLGNRFKQLPTKATIKTGEGVTENTMTREFEYFTNEGYITLINAKKTEKAYDLSGGGMTEQTIESSYKIIYEDEE